MRSISIDATSVAQTGATHCNLVIDSHDVGVLYLSEEEKQLLLTVLRKGAISMDGVMITENNHHDNVEEFDLLDDED